LQQLLGDKLTQLFYPLQPLPAAPDITLIWINAGIIRVLAAGLSVNC
jgi:hypothetical protein